MTVERDKQTKKPPAMNHQAFSECRSVKHSPLLLLTSPYQLRLGGGEFLTELLQLRVAGLLHRVSRRKRGAALRVRIGSEAAALAWGSRVRCTPKTCREIRSPSRLLRARCVLSR